MTLDDLKAELNIDHDLDDALLTRKLDEAIDHVETWTGRKLADLDPIPAALSGAVIRIAAHWYDNGDGMPEGVTDKLLAHRLWSF